MHFSHCFITSHQRKASTVTNFFTLFKMFNAVFDFSIANLLHAWMLAVQAVKNQYHAPKEKTST